ncbi:MAG TPA: GGDEF domain-containing protein [Patescibacteria group bacterium]|nr:GGDEF domain-containing protein [Patescibacteria group bacterium]
MADEVKETPQKSFKQLRQDYKAVRPKAKQTALQLSQIPGSKTENNWKTRKAMAQGMMAVNEDVNRVHEELKKTIEAHEIELKKAQEEGRTDSLTGLLNRRGFKERLKAEIERSMRNGQILGLVALDLDNFKLVNDNHGHPIGDKVIKAVAEIINNHAAGKESVTREIDIAARTGEKGDEFYVILPDIKDGLELAAGRIRIAIQNKLKNMVPEIQDIPVTSSLGATTFFMNPDNSPKTEHMEALEKISEDLINQADDALIISKNLGKNKLSIFDPSINMPQGK